MGKRNQLIDCARVFFAASIVMLHVPNTSEFISWYSSTISRLGVPFFFLIAGYFGVRGGYNGAYVKTYICKIGRLFLIWLAVYFPYIAYSNRYEGVLKLFQELVFKTPAFLWYLMALLVGTILAAAFYGKRISIPLFAALYIIGCLGNTYVDFLSLRSLWDPYLSVFLTTRNGVFFAPIFIALGNYLYEHKEIRNRKVLYGCTVISGVLFFAETVWVNLENGDGSFYFMLPAFVYCICKMLVNTNLNMNSDSRIYRDYSTLLYCSQYGFIVVNELFARLILHQHDVDGFMMLIAVYIETIVFYVLLRKIKAGKRLLRIIT